MKKRVMQKIAEKQAVIYKMKEDPNMIIMGEGIIYNRVMYEIATGLNVEFGDDRVFDVPIAETGIAGVAIGLAMNGCRTMYMHDRADFLFLTFDQLINHGAKYSYMSGGQVKVPLLIWAMISEGKGGAAQHSQSIQANLMNIPGIKIVMPSCPSDAKGLMRASLNEMCPVVFLEHQKCLEQADFVSEDDYIIPLGQGEIKREGSDITIICFSVMVSRALIAAKKLEEDGISVEVLDIRTIKPYDKDLIIKSVNKTRRCIVLDTSCEMGSVAKEISEYIYHELFNVLLCPIEIIALPNAPAPVSEILEDEYYIDDNKIYKAVKSIF